MKRGRKQSRGLSVLEGLEGRTLLSDGVIGGVVRKIEPTFGGSSTQMPMGGVTVYVDANANHQLDNDEPSAITDDLGIYSIVTSASISQVNVVPPAGWIRADQTFVITGDTRNFILGPQPTITGVLRENFAGSDQTNPVLAGVRVFLDRNSNDVADDGEETALTDADGKYIFQPLSVGQVKIQLVDSDGWSVMLPYATINVAANGATVSQDQEVYRSKTITGVVFNDLNRNGIRDQGEPGVGAAAVYAPFSYTPPNDLFMAGLGDIGSIFIYPVPCVGGYATSAVYCPNPNSVVRILTYTADDGSFTLHDMPLQNPTAAVDPQKFVRATAANDTSDFQQIGVIPVTPGSYGVVIIKGRVFDDVNGNGVMDDGEGPLAGVHVGAREQAPQAAASVTLSSGQLNVSGSSGTDRGITTILASAGTVTDADGCFHIIGLRQGAYSLGIEKFYNDGLDSNDIHLNLGPLDINETNIPAHPFSVIAGTVIRENGNPGQGLTVFLDRNNNGKLDPGESNQPAEYAGRFRFAHVSDGPYVVRVITSSHLRLISSLPQGNVTRGIMSKDNAISFDAPFTWLKIQAYLDRNRNGRHDKGEHDVHSIIVEADFNDNNLEDGGEGWGFAPPRGRFKLYFPYGRTKVSFSTTPEDKAGLFSRKIIVDISDVDADNRILVGLLPKRNVRVGR